MDQPITRAEHISIHALREEGDPFSAVRFWLQKVFLSTPSARRATCVQLLNQRIEVISIHALREEGDPLRTFRLLAVIYFYPRPPRGGRLVKPRDLSLTAAFLSTPSARRATAASVLRAAPPPHFYPRPPRGGRRKYKDMIAARMKHFYPRPPRGGRLLAPGYLSTSSNFYPRPPRGGRHKTALTKDFARSISIHALREEGDLLHECRVK